MAKKGSDSSSDIKTIHYALINSLVKGNVGHNENKDSYVNWVLKFSNITNDPTELEKSVLRQFQYLEGKYISPGKYDLLKDIFSEDHNALSKIDQAEKEIKSRGSLSKIDQEDKEEESKDIFSEIDQEETEPAALSSDDENEDEENLITKIEREDFEEVIAELNLS